MNALMKYGYVICDDERKVYTITRAGQVIIDAMLDFNDELRAFYDRAVASLGTDRLARLALLLEFGDQLQTT